MISLITNTLGRETLVRKPVELTSRHNEVWLRFTSLRLDTKTIAERMGMPEYEASRLLYEAREAKRFRR